MALSLVDLCSRKVVSDHGWSARWLRCVPGELYGSLLRAAFAGCRPLAVGELVQRWPQRSLRVGEPGQSPPNRLCVQALLLAVVRGLSDERCALQLLDLCGLQRDEGSVGDPMGGWSLTVALCTMVVQAQTGAQRVQRREVERERKRFLAMEREKDVVKRERAPHGTATAGDVRDGGEAEAGERSELAAREQEVEAERLKGVRRRMEEERRRDGGAAGGGGRSSPQRDASDGARTLVIADLFVNARSWERVQGALAATGPLKLQCRYLRVEELSVSSIRKLLELLPPCRLLGIDIRYSSLGVEGLAALLPQLAAFPALSSLRLHYCNLDIRRDQEGQQEALSAMSLGLAQLVHLRRLSLTALRLPGQLRMLLSSLSQPLEALELLYLSLSPADLAFLSCSRHATTLQLLDLSESPLESALPSVRRLLSQASGTLRHLTLSGCGLTDVLLGALLPSLGCCGSLRTLGLALNPLSAAGLLELVRMAARMASLRRLQYPYPLEDYQPGLPELPSSAQLLDWPLEESVGGRATAHQLDRVLRESGRSDLLLTCDLLHYDNDSVC